MAKFNEILAPRFNRYLQRYLNMKGGPPSPTLSGDITAGFEIEAVPAELRYLVGWKRFVNSAATLGVATQNVNVRIRNPVGSNVIAVFEKIVFSITTGVAGRVNWNMQIPGTDTTNTFASSKFDNRQEGALGVGSTLTFTSGQNVAVFPLTLGVVFLPLNTPYDFIQASQNQEISLAPGSTWEFTTLPADGNGLFFTCIWRERLLEEGERVQ